MNGTKLVVYASSLLLAATARARCVFVHVAVSVRLPSPRALRLNAYINQCGSRSSGVPAGGVSLHKYSVSSGIQVIGFVSNYSKKVDFV